MKYRATLLLLKKVSRLLSILPRQTLTGMGRFLGSFWFYVIRIRRSVVLSNLQKVFPHNIAVHRQTALGFFRHFCVTLLEFLAFDHQRCGNIHLQVSGMAHLQRALAKKKGVVVVTAHMGNFDLLACHQAISGLPLAIISRNLHSRAINDFWMNKRKKCGVRIFDDNSPPIGVVRWLMQGKVLGLVVDQRLSASKGGIRVPFFGYDVWTSAAAGNLVLRTGAALIPAMIHRTSKWGSELIIEPEIEVAQLNGKVTARHLMMEIHKVVEKWVIAYPEEWMWIHRRFKNAVEIEDKNKPV